MQKVLRREFVLAAENELQRDDAIEPGILGLPDFSQTSGCNPFQKNERSDVLFRSTSENGQPPALFEKSA
jgi:hypothetical protein